MGEVTQMAYAKANAIRSSPQKVNLVLQLIRGRHISDAINLLQTSQRRVSIEVQKVLMSAVANAENNHDMDVDNLFVHEAIVGKAFVMKRMRPRARGRGAKILKPYSNVHIKLVEKEV